MNRSVAVPWPALVGLALALPALYFVPANILKYELGLLKTMEIVPISPLVLLGGVGLAIALNLTAVVKLDVHRRDGAWVITTTVRPRGWNLLVLAGAAFLLTVLLAYAVVENLTVH